MGVKILGGETSQCTQPEAGKKIVACFCKAGVKGIYCFILYFISSQCTRANSGYDTFFLFQEISKWGSFWIFFFFKNKFISSSQNMDRLSSPHFIKKNDYNKKEKRMKSLVYPVIKTMDRVLPNGAISTEAMGLRQGYIVSRKFFIWIPG